VLTPSRKGAIAETAIAHAATKLGVDVFAPIGEGGRCDLIFAAGPQLLRIQCKWAARRGNVLVIHCGTSRRGRDGFVRRQYTADEVDAFAGYCIELDRCYFIPADICTNRWALQLRLEPTRNNQSIGIHWARDFEFAATLPKLGAIAQLGERLRGTQKVAGSSPAGSIGSSLRPRADKST
jgi:hypothetical protein